MSMKALIIGYHCVKDEANSFIRPTKVADFENQMRYLSQRYNPISLETLAQHIHNGTPLPSKAVTVTIDDGYQDNYENAYPILKKYNIPATIFLISSLIGTEGIPEWDKGYYTDKKTLMMSWEQVRQMSDDGISFGSHTLTHPFLTRITHEQAQKEIFQSRDIIEQQIGKPVNTFAYPTGDFNSEVKEIVKEAGYSCAVTTVPGKNGMHNDIHALNRNVVQIKSFYQKFFPLSYFAEITGMVGHMRDFYYRLRGRWVPGD